MFLCVVRVRTECASSTCKILCNTYNYQKLAARHLEHVHNPAHVTRGVCYFCLGFSSAIFDKHLFGHAAVCKRPRRVQDKVAENGPPPRRVRDPFRHLALFFWLFSSAIVSGTISGTIFDVVAPR